MVVQCDVCSSVRHAVCYGYDSSHRQSTLDRLLIILDGRAVVNGPACAAVAATLPVHCLRAL